MRLSEKIKSYCNGNVQENDGVIISKCLGCNRITNFNENIVANTI